MCSMIKKRGERAMEKQGPRTVIPIIWFYTSWTASFRDVGGWHWTHFAIPVRDQLIAPVPPAQWPVLPPSPLPSPNTDRRPSTAVHKRKGSWPHAALGTRSFGFLITILSKDIWKLSAMLNLIVIQVYSLLVLFVLQIWRDQKIWTYVTLVRVPM